MKMITLTKHDRAFKDMLWLVKGASKDDTRHSINVIHYTGKSLQATCGWQARTLEMLDEDYLNYFSDVEKGTCFSIVKATSSILILQESCDINYPSFEQITPTRSENKSVVEVSKENPRVSEISAILTNREGRLVVFNDLLLTYGLGINSLITTKKDSVNWSIDVDHGREAGANIFESTNENDTLKRTLLIMEIRIAN